MPSIFPHIPPPGPIKFNSRHPEHRRYTSPSRARALRFMPRLSHAYYHIAGMDRAGATFQAKGKNGGPTFYGVEPLTKGGLPSGIRITRITRDGKRLPRLRNNGEGKTGKQMVRALRKELREERNRREK